MSSQPKIGHAYVITSAKGVLTITQVEAKQVTLLENPNLLNRDVQFDILHSKNKALIGERWYGWAFYETGEDAKRQALKDIRAEAERTARKAHTEVDEEVLQEKFKTILWCD